MTKRVTGQVYILQLFKSKLPFSYIQTIKFHYYVSELNMNPQNKAQFQC